MKKFLTVLLVIAVMFTFSFSSAFAATTENLTTADAFVKSAVNVAEGQARLNSDLSKAAQDYAAAEASKVAQLILSYLVDQNGYDIDTTAGMDAFKAEFTKWALGTATVQDPLEKIGTGDLAFAMSSYADYFSSVATKTDYEAKVAEAVDQIKAIDTTVFSTKTNTVDSKDYTYKTYAEKLIADCVKTLQDKTKVTDQNYKTEIKKLLYGETGTKDAPVGGLYLALYGNKTTDGLLTVEDEKELETGATIDIDYAKAQLAYKAKVELYGQWKVAKGDDATAKFNVNSWATKGKIGDITVLDTVNKKVMGVSVANPAKLTAEEATAINAAIMDVLTKTLEVANVSFDELDVKTVGTNGTVAQHLNLLLTTDSDAVIDRALKAMKKYADAEAVAADKKNAVMFDGSKQYADADIDEALAKDKADIYGNFMNEEWTAENNLGKVITIVDPVANALQEAKDKFQDHIIYTGAKKTAEADKKYCKDFYDNFFASKYDKIAKKAKDALDEVKTVEEITAIMADADAALAKLRTQAELDDMDKALNAKYQEAVQNYADQVMKNRILASTDYDAKSFTDVVKKYIGENKAFATRVADAGLIDKAKNMDDVKALYEEAKKEIDTLITQKELDAKAKEVSDAIAKLPATVDTKLTTEDQFMAAKDAYEAYLALYGAEKADVVGYVVFESKMAALKTAQQNATNDTIKALPAVAKITVADKAAIEAARAMYDKYYDQYDEAFTANETALKEAEKALYNAEVAAVKQMILKLTDASSSEDVAAAKAAYEALSGSQQRKVKEGLGSYLYKLDKFEEMTIAAVTSLKLTAKSSAKKGSITVKWTVKGDASAADGYQVWKSTKQSKGYKKAITTTKKSYKNTKGLKKGTRYYYKVRAYKVVDGKNVYSDWSNKAYRVAK